VVEPNTDEQPKKLIHRERKILHYMLN